MRLLHDLKAAIRSLRKSPGTAVLSIAVLMIGIGANSAMFSIVNSLLYQPQKFEDPESIVGIYPRDTETLSYDAVSYPAYEDLRQRATSFSDIAAHNLAMAGVGDGDDARRTFIDGVSANYFDLFGIQPHFGRWFTPEEADPDTVHRLAVLGHSMWQRRGADPQVIGSEIALNGTPYTIVGVAPEGFGGFTSVFAPDLFIPLSALGDLSSSSDSRSGSLADRKNSSLMVIGRLAEGSTRESAGIEVASIGSQLAEEWPVIHERLTFEVHPLSRSSVSTDPTNDTSMTILSTLLLAMSFAILLVAALNLSTMQAARSAARRSEMAIRLALGGGRATIVRQVLTEGFLLAIVGGGLGLILAWFAPRILTASLMRISPIQFELGGSIDWRVITATLVFCTLATLIFGLLPALRLSRQDLSSALQEGQRGDVGGRRGLFARANLPVVSEIALTLVLLVVGGLFLEGALRSTNVDPGFDLDRGIVAEIDTSFLGLDQEAGTALAERVVERLEALPGIESVSQAATVPFGIMSMARSVQPIDAPLPEDGGETTSARANYISGSYFETLGLPLLRGRTFNKNESEKVVIIDQILADELWPDQEALGQMVRLPANDDGERPVAEVVGLVASSRDTLLSAEARPHIFFPTRERFLANQQIHLRTAPGVGEAQMLDQIRTTMRSVDSQLPILQLRTLNDHFDASFDVWVLRTGATIFGLFAAIALLLAVAGVYGVRAYSVSRRTRELGLRAALGSSRGRTLRLVLREGMTMTLIGGAIGLALALAVSRALSSFLVGVNPWSPAVFVSAFAVLLAVMAVACLIPARRAAQLSPLEALRQE